MPHSPTASFPTRPPAAAEARGAALAFAGVRHTYAGPPPVEALAEVSLQAAGGEFAALIGPSGCGKSTILRMFAGLLRPTAGAVAIGGEDVAGRPGGAAYMPQGSALLPWRRVRDNAVLGAEVAGLSRQEAHARAGPLFARFGLSGFEHSWPWQLSGGMRQRLALLRTFLTPKPVLLLDEPLGALDAITRRAMHGWLQDVWRSDGRTVLLVTHDVEEALILADTVHVMSPRPGRIVERIAVPLPRPRTSRDTTASGFVALKARVLAALENEEPHAGQTG
jgi:ABC-type nitrate/sulfonate/bicarbonate transport system ATPase subunit